MVYREREIDALTRPTADEVQQWREEQDHFLYFAPIPHAPPNSEERLGWGIPEDRIAPDDCVRYVICKFRESDLDLYHHDPNDRGNYVPIHPKFGWSITEAVYAHFAWFATYPGAQWVNQFFGVQDVEPFRNHSVYCWVNPDDPSDSIELTPELGHLSIFRPWDRDNKPPTRQPKFNGMTPFEQMSQVMDYFRRPSAPKAPTRSEELYTWVSEQILGWFSEEKPNAQWPYPSSKRITARQWMMDQPRFEGVRKIHRYHQEAYDRRSSAPIRAYRWIPKESGLPIWFGSDQMAVIPLTDWHRKFRHDMTEPQVQDAFRCSSCRQVRPCLPETSKEGLCVHCYAVQVERGTDMPTLERCTMLPECKACPQRIDSRTALIQLRNRLNQNSFGKRPIPR